MIKVSILIPVYNIADFLPRCLDSCINQTLKEIEIICVNDGSTDGSLALLSEYVKKDNRIKIVNKENGGLPSARNAGMDAATGEYFLYLDGDDFIELDACEILYKKAKETNANVVIFGGKTYPLDRNDPWMNTVLTTPDKFYKTVPVDDFLHEPYMTPFLWRNFIKRDFIEKNHFRLDEEIHVGEDLAFQFKILPTTTNVSVIHNKLYNYDISRDGSLTNNQNYKKIKNRLYMHIFMIEKLYYDWTDRGIMSRSKDYFYDWVVNFLYWNFNSVSTTDKQKVSKAIVDLFTIILLFKNTKYLSSYRKQQVNDMTKWADREIADEKKDITLFLILDNQPKKEAVFDLLTYYSKHNQSLKIIGVMDRMDLGRFAEIETLCKDFSFFSMQTYDDSLSDHLNTQISKSSSKYFSFVRTNYYPLSDFEDVCKNLKDEPDILVTAPQMSDLLSFVNIPIENFFVKKQVAINEHIFFDDYGDFILDYIKAKLWEVKTNYRTVYANYFSFNNENIKEFRENGINKKIRSLNFILALLRIYSETKDESFRQYASMLYNNKHFVYYIVSTPFAWNKNDLTMVRKLYEKIIEISNTNLILYPYSVNQMMYNFIRNLHNNESGIQMLIENKK